MKYLFGLAVSTADEDVQSKDIIDLELLVIDFLLEGLTVDDDLVSVDQVLLEVVGQDSFQRGHLVRIADFLDGVGDLVVEISWLDQSDGSLGSFVGSKKDICLFAGHGSLGIGLDDNGVSSKGSKTIDMGSEFDLDKISFLDGSRLFGHGRVVAADLVDGDTGGEGDSLEDLLLVVDFAQLFDEVGVAEEAELEDLGADRDLFNNFGKDVWVRHKWYHW